jgi:hypothetical protein
MLRGVSPGSPVNAHESIGLYYLNDAFTGLNVTISGMVYNDV